ncbi:hypothetical protein JOB18_000499 [Solea senegalensis]|uniref:Uncharacterized protein n=1 Tax=Solea senegalensis TaxID=28829 RepID=A0AAV6RRP4_SOLSE|nr:uncharacterized protein C1orf131 homolog [Solea senegalensis]KAG7508015.1 hypothetical protein JOB18_000499 [Solea senegalensis]KAG7508016.1 hypothetical protein JOB18_000499 [Solea senegalensis]
MSSKVNGAKDEDSLFIEQLLDTFYEYDNGPASKFKKLKSQKRRKRKHQEEEEEEFSTVKDICNDTDDQREESTGTEQHQHPKTEQTGSTTQQVNQVEVVTFQDPRKILKAKRTPVANTIPAAQTTETMKNSDQLEGISLEKARLEVHRFGITGYKKEQQRVFEQDRAIMLGARPPKKEYVNYKMLQQQIKEKKQKVKEEVDPELKKKKKKPNNQKDKKKVSSGSGAGPSGQVGRFKNGMLVLSSKEIQKIKGRRK